MKLEDARSAKRRLMSQLDGRGMKYPNISTYSHNRAQSWSQAQPNARIAVGIAVFEQGKFGIALRLTGPPAFDSRMWEPLREELLGELDVREVGHIVPHHTPTITLALGASLGLQQPRTTGTLGAFVKERKGSRRFILSNNHVLAGENMASIGDEVFHPGTYDSGSRICVGTLARMIPLTVAMPNVVDAALCATHDNIVGSNNYFGQGAMSIGTAEDGLDVQKIGRTTGLTSGTVTAFDLSAIPVDYSQLGTALFNEVIEISGANGNPFSDHGDSGSLIYCPSMNSAIGLLFAGSDRNRNITYANPIGVALDALDVELV